MTLGDMTVWGSGGAGISSWSLAQRGICRAVVSIGAVDGCSRVRCFRTVKHLIGLVLIKASAKPRCSQSTEADGVHVHGLGLVQIQTGSVDAEAEAVESADSGTCG
jgi:hypothetical protein